MSSTIDLQLSPTAAEFYAVIDVLVAVGLDLAHRDGQGASAARSDARLTREREGLDIALCMLGELAARQSAHSARARSTARTMNLNVKRNGASGNGLETTPIALLLHRIGGRYLGK